MSTSEYAHGYVAKSEILASLRAIGFTDSTCLGGDALRLPREWVEDIAVLFDGCDPHLVMSTPGGTVFASLDQKARVDDDADDRLAAAPTPSHENCEHCGRWHRKGEPHCPNCGQPAESLFHAAWDLEKCPHWLFGRWVMKEDFTDADRAELARLREGASS